MPNSIIKWNVEDECKRWYLSLKLKSNNIKYTWRVEPKNNNKKIMLLFFGNYKPEVGSDE